MASKLTKSYIPEILALSFFRSKPSMVTVNLTKRCNQNCIYCEIGISETSAGHDLLTKNDLFWIIDQMVIHKIRKISLCGGEPFLFEGIIDVVAYAGERNIHTSITTNGMTTYRLNDNDLNILKYIGTEINISIDSFDPAIQSLTRGNPNALSNALQSVSVLLHHKIPVTVLTVISKYNYDSLLDFTKQTHEKGIQQLLFQPVIYYSNYPERTAVENKSQLNVGGQDLDVLLNELKEILKFEKDHKIKTNVYRIIPWIKDYLETAIAEKDTMFFKDLLPTFFCREIYAIIDISYDGGIQPCGLSKASVTIFEQREKGLMALWLEATRQIRQDLEQGKFYDYCNGCCHHFSRNMLASIYKSPFKNRKAFYKIAPLMLSRVKSGIVKKMTA